MSGNRSFTRVYSDLALFYKYTLDLEERLHKTGLFYTRVELLSYAQPTVEKNLQSLHFLDFHQVGPHLLYKERLAHCNVV